MVLNLPKGFRYLTREAFEPCVGEEFEAHATPVSVRIRLDELVKLEHGPGFLTREPFVLLWSTPCEVNMLLGIYQLCNGGWGPHAVYIEPMQTTPERRRYQSVYF